jgi:VIT1/CCC1 family predicted Fe2+/Mn2+ transporter
LIDQVHNESLKLNANWCNAMSVAIIASGVVLPIFAYLFSPDANAAFPDFGLLTICVAVGLLLHMRGQWVLGGLESE